MSDGVNRNMGGEFATSRRGGVAEDFDFIIAKAQAGFPVSAIARMVARPVSEVGQLVAGASVVAAAPRPRPQPVEAPAPEPRQWRVWREDARVKGPRPLPPFARQLVASVAAKHDLSVEDLVGLSRKKPISRARQEAFYILHTAGRGYSKPQIASWFSGRDHSTVFHGIAAHAERLAADPDFQAWKKLGAAA